MDGRYHEGSRELQNRFDTRRLAEVVTPVPEWKRGELAAGVLRGAIRPWSSTRPPSARESPPAIVSAADVVSAMTWSPIAGLRRRRQRRRRRSPTASRHSVGHGCGSEATSSPEAVVDWTQMDLPAGQETVVTWSTSPAASAPGSIGASPQGTTSSMQ